MTYIKQPFFLEAGRDKKSRRKAISNIKEEGESNNKMFYAAILQVTTKDSQQESTWKDLLFLKLYMSQFRNPTPPTLKVLK